MSYFVTVTFDIQDARVSPGGTDVYRRITNALDDINFAKYCKGEKNVVAKLPSNTYVAKFPGDQDAASSKQLVGYVSRQLDRIFRTHGVHGKYFVVVGDRWAWRRKSF